MSHGSDAGGADGSSGSVDDPHDLARFVQAQEQSGTYERALAELRRGRKQSHWMWFVFPQVEGLGSSTMARKYAVSSLAEARAYLEHPLLGARLRDCVQVLLDLSGHDPLPVVGAVDSMKLRSSLTLFEAATSDGAPFAEALDRYYAGRRDRATLDRLSST